MKRLNLFLILVFILSQRTHAQTAAQWRGPHRNGVFPETGLLKSWPESGPELLWAAEGLDTGYSSPSVTNHAVYLTGREGRTEFLTALDLDGNRLWRIQFGSPARQTHPDSRSTPAVDGDRIYLISGSGEVVCIDGKEQRLLWTVPVFEEFEGEHWVWEIAESPLIVDDKVIFTPGGHKTTMVALDKQTGRKVWQTESLQDTTAFVSPILVEYGQRKIIVNVLINYVIGVDAEDGSVMWKVMYSEIEPPTDHPLKPHNNCITPLYHDGHLYVTSGYDHVGVMFRLKDGGRGIEQIWKNSTLDCHHGQVVRVGDFIYGSNWIDNRNGNWCCVDWRTGVTRYEKPWKNKGSISAADGMLYCYEEMGGTVALVEPTPEDFTIVSSFRITEGRGPHWTQPVIHDGVLYIRHGDVLMAFDIKA